MPNHVFNSVAIQGTSEQLKMVQEFLATPTFMNQPDEELIFNFAKLISIPKDKVEEYHTTHGFSEGKATGETEFNWYNWNNRCWGTKWNAYDVETDLQDGLLQYRFCTAWSYPEPIIHALADYAQQGGITFEWYAEEEQGWGAEFVFNGTELELVREWDIPESHAEYVALDRECWACDSEMPYPDCPKVSE